MRTRGRSETADGWSSTASFLECGGGQRIDPESSGAKMLKQAIAAAVLASWSMTARGQETPQATVHVKVETIPARVADVSSIDAIVRAMYEVISGPRGAPRQWARDRTLYLPGTRFMWTDREGPGPPRLINVDHQGAVDLLDKDMVAEGDFSREIHRTTQAFGNVGHVFSTYESRHSLNGPVVGRGINDLQLVYDGRRWWITALSFDEEGPGRPIPKEFLPDKTNGSP